MMNSAINQGRYFTSGAAAIASAAGLGANNPDGVLTFVDGDFTLGPGSPTGQGTLIVTGNLILDGNFNWNGVIMVLGKGHVLRSGGGHGNIYGAMFVARFARTRGEYRRVWSAILQHEWRRLREYPIQFRRGR